MKKEKGEISMRHTSVRSIFLLSPFNFNPTSSSLPPYSLTLIKLHKSHLGNSSKLKLVFFLVARQKLSKLIFTLTPASVDCARFGVGCLFTSYHTAHTPNS